MTAPLVSFVIPVRNDAERLKHCLQSIQANRLDGTELEVIVVDNESTDGSADIARTLGARVLRSDASSVATLRNIGAREASGDILAFVDADNEIVSGWVRAALDTLRMPHVGAAGALYHAPSNGTWVQRTYGLLRGTPAGLRDVDWLGSGNIAVRRELFAELAGFDGALTTCEDVDFSNRVRDAGYRILSNAAMKNVHHGDPETLWAVFQGERWRGQDNLRVSFRSTLAWRALPSVVIPIADLMLIVAGLAGTAAAVIGVPAGLWVAIAALALVGAGALLRALRVAFTEGTRHPLQLTQLWLVSCAYDFGRALSLIARAPHRNVSAAMVPAR